MEIEILASSSYANAYIVRDGEQSILIDCGLPFKKLMQKSNFSLSKLDFCLISHEHKDHCRAFPGIQNLGVNCAMSLGTFNTLGADPNYTITKIISNPVYNIESGVIFNHKGWSVLPFSTQHDAKEPLGFLILTPSNQKICYATDTYYIKYKFSGVTHWMIECNYSQAILEKNQGLKSIIKNRIIASHFEFENVKEFFLKQDLLKTDRIFIIHLSKDNSDPIRFSKEIEKITGKPVLYIKQ